MTPSELQLLTDAVKIGFPIVGTIAGALIGGIATYFLTKLNQKHDERKELTKRRFDMLIQTANDITEFEHLMGIYITEIGIKVQGGKNVTDINEAKLNVYTKTQSLRRARMALKVLGLKDAEAHLEKYIEYTREVTKYGTNLSKDRVNELSKIIVVGPVDFYESLSKEISIKN